MFRFSRIAEHGVSSQASHCLPCRALTRPMLSAMLEICRRPSCPDGSCGGRPRGIPCGDNSSGLHSTCRRSPIHIPANACLARCGATHRPWPPGSGCRRQRVRAAMTETPGCDCLLHSGPTSRRVPRHEGLPVVRAPVIWLPDIVAPAASVTLHELGGPPGNAPPVIAWPDEDVVSPLHE